MSCNIQGCVQFVVRNLLTRHSSTRQTVYKIQYQYQREWVISAVCDMNIVITKKRRNGSKSEI